ncbi:MAG TPA: recombinase family protein [Rubrobacter sp.]|nr:recombinase family protein [Rubrobacter sp.]
MTPRALNLVDAPARPRRLVFVKRVSQRHGREGESFMSPEQQTDLAFDYVRHSGDQIIETVDETDTVSGKTVDREGLQRAIWMCFNGEADGIIVANVRRFARTRRKGEAAIYDLVEAGKSFVAVKERIDNGGGKLDRMSEKWLNDTLMNAEWEREDLVAGCADVRRRHIAAGKAVRAPYGYRKNKAGRLIPYAPEARWVRLIFDLRAAGKGWAPIAEELNQRRVKPPQPNSEKVTASKRWVAQHIVYLVNNRTYLGELRRGPDVNLTSHEPIIPLALWGAAHAIRSASGHSTRVGPFYILRGLVRCATCGGRMTPGYQPNGSGVPVRFYRCKKRYTWGVCPRPAVVSADDLEAEAVTFFESRALGFFRSSTRRLNVDLDAAKEKLAEARAELVAYTLATSAAADAVGPELFAAGLAQRAAAVVAAEEAEVAARAAALGTELPTSLVREWKESANDEARAAVLGRLIHCIAVKPSAKSGTQDPAAGRIRIFILGERTCPKDLPGRPQGSRPKGAKRPENKITPINF